MSKDTSKPISFKTVQKNKKLGEFDSDDIGIRQENQQDGL